MAQETTLILFKPDAVKQDLVGTVLARYQAEGFKIRGIKMMSLSDEILAEHTGQPVERIHSDTDRDFILEANEAVEYGIIDRVISSREAIDRTGPIR